ncbi:MAG: methyltransferase, partial [Rickettsiales bacterium]
MQNNPLTAIWQSIDRYIGRGQRFAQEFFNRASAPIDVQYGIALKRMQEGEFEDAATRLKMVVKFRPQHVDAWYQLGICASESGDVADAEEAYQQVLHLNPAHEEARFMLAVASPMALPQEQQPKFTPLSLATPYFDDMAADYDVEQLEVLGYHGHERLHESVSKFLKPDYRHYHIVDLGCGTGLVGTLFRDVAGKMEGVDISPAMLEQAANRRDSKGRAVYDELHTVDLRRFLLDQTPTSVDIITAANVFPYVGGLTPVFDGAVHILKVGGLFAFTVEETDAPEFGLIAGEGRFGHQDAYIIEQAKRVGMDVVESRPVALYDDYEAMQYVLRKSAPNVVGAESQNMSQPKPAQPATPAQSQAPGYASPAT